jgi:predicted DsbA family dithiol-disulfide isomerase
MIIEVLGIGDGRSDQLEAVVRDALGRSGQAQVTVLRFDDPARMVARGVRRVPGLVFDGKVVCRGRVPAAEEIKGWLAAAEAKDGGPTG